jgi:hypothetical protein
MTATASARGRSNRNRGARAEVQVVNWLRDHGYPDARRYLAGDGRQPGDIDAHPLLVIEVKDCAASSWPTWCRQAAAEAPPGTVPVVVRRTRGVTDVGLWECRVPAGDWLSTQAEGTALPVDGDQYLKVDGTLWALTAFGWLVAAVRALDEEMT